MALRSDLVFIQSDDTQLTLFVRQDDGVTPYDLTGKRIELLVKASEWADDGDAIFQISSVAGAPVRITITDAVNGLGVADLSNLLEVAGIFWFETWVADVTDPLLDKETWAYGTWTVGSGATSTALGPCRPWADELPEACLASLPDDYDSSTVLSIATSTLWRLSGRRIGLCDRTVRPCMQECWETQWGNSTYLPGGFAGPPVWGTFEAGTWWPYRAVCGRCGDDSCSCSSLCEIRLLGPVWSIGQVTVEGAVLDPAAYRVDNRRILVRTDGGCWPRCQDSDQPFVVSYIRGVAPPPDAIRACTDLAFELAKAECGSGGCRLPARLTAIVRQGVTADTVIDDLDFLEKGRTGLYFVDLFLRSANPKGVSRGARVYRADAKVPRVTTG